MVKTVDYIGLRVALRVIITSALATILLLGNLLLVSSDYFSLNWQSDDQLVPKGM